MDHLMNFLFLYYPYICLSVMLCGMVCRYLNAPGTWNSRSTEIMEKKLLRVGSPLFHLGVLLALLGHIGGLLLPDAFWTFVLGSTDRHDAIAMFVGKFVAVFMAVGLGILLGRRLAFARVRAASAPADYIIVALLFVNIATGIYLLFFMEVALFFPMGSWLRGVLTFRPDASYMTGIPVFMQVHAVSAFTIFALIPFSRLVHIFSAPLSYALRPFIVYKKRSAEIR